MVQLVSDLVGELFGWCEVVVVGGLGRLCERTEVKLERRRAGEGDIEGAKCSWGEDKCKF